MSRRLVSLVPGALLLALFALPLGCTSRLMRPVGPSSIAPQPEMATIVFVRPSIWSASQQPTILDENGGFVGEADAKAYFVAHVPPGDHMFVAWGEKHIAPIRATVDAGRTYFIEVSVLFGVWLPRCHLLAITPRSEHWPEVRGWLHDTKRTEADVQAGNEYLASRREAVDERMSLAREAFAELDEDEREKRTLRPNDGIAEAIAP